MKILIFDTETTGLPKTKLLTNEVLHLLPYIVQHSYVIFNTLTKKIEMIQDQIIKIPVDIPIGIETTNIHGITKEISLLEGKDLKKILLSFIEDYENCDLIVGHNLWFDINMLKIETTRLIQTSDYFEKLCLEEFLKKLDVDSANNKHFCTMKASIHFCNIKAINKKGKEYIKFPKLSELYEKLFNNIPNNLHNSLHDVLICLRCFYQMEYKEDLLMENKKIRDLFIKLGL
jgi:DNA polymerase III epsilon subunit-like protein